MATTSSMSYARAPFLVVCLLTMVTTINAQYKPERVQKWRTDWQNPETPDSIRFKAADRLAMRLHKNDLDSALYYVGQQIAFSRKKNNDDWIAESLFNKASILKKSGSYPEAKQAYLDAIKAQNKVGDIRGVAYSYIGMAYALRKEGQLAEALKHYQLSVDLSEKLGEKGHSMAAAAFNGMGSLHLDQGDYDKALEYYQKSLDFHLAIDKEMGIAANYNNISQVYYFLEKYEQAMQYLEKSRLIKKKLNDFSGLGNTYHNLGDLAVKAGKLALANEYYLQSLAYRDSLDHKGDMAASYSVLGYNAIRIGDAEMAADYCRQGLKLSNEIGDVEEAASNADCLYRAFDETGQADSALFYHVLMVKLKDSLFNQENTRKLTEIELQYQHEKETARIQAELRRQRLIRNAMFGVGALLLLLVYLIYRINRIRAKKNQELELKNQQIETDRAVIAQQAEELKALDQMKSRFFANISHELRTPVTLISTPITHALERYQESMQQEVKRILSLAKRNAQKLMHLIEELLELSRIESGKVDLEKKPVLLNPFFNQLISAYESTANIKNMDLRLDYQLPEEEVVLLDKGRVSKIVNNLLSNALKFTPEGGVVVVTVGCLPNTGLSGQFAADSSPSPHLSPPSSDEAQRRSWITTHHSLLVTVSDTGRGIPEKDLKRVFERFYQVQDEEQPVEGGTGIGLALSRELALLMNGNLTVESQVGQGSTFFLSLPLEKAPQAETHPSPFTRRSPQEKSGLTFYPTKPPGEIGSHATKPTGEVGSHTTKPIGEVGHHHLPDEAHRRSWVPHHLTPEHRLLIVEDNPDMQQLLISVLEEHYQCTVASNGLEAWQMLQSEDYSIQDFDLILSDVMMPEMDGYALLERIKSDAEWRQLPIVLLTARAAEEDKLKALRLGVDDYLPKPFSSVELMARIENLIANYEQRKELKQLGIELDLEAPPSADGVWLSELEEVCLHALDKQIKINNAYLAIHLNTSERQLLRRIKGLTGLSVSKYVQEVKLQKARNLLEHQAYSTVAEVAYECGFNTPAYFSNVFEKRFGKRPVDYLGE